MIHLNGSFVYRAGQLSSSLPLMQQKKDQQLLLNVLQLLAIPLSSQALPVRLTFDGHQRVTLRLNQSQVVLSKEIQKAVARLLRGESADRPCLLTMTLYPEISQPTSPLLQIPDALQSLILSNVASTVCKQARLTSKALAAAGMTTPMWESVSFSLNRRPPEHFFTMLGRYGSQIRSLSLSHTPSFTPLSLPLLTLFRQVATLTQLRSLTVDELSPIDERICQQIAQCTQLTTLSIDNGKLRSDHLPLFSSLNALTRLKVSSLEGEDFSSLMLFSFLQALDIHSSRIDSGDVLRCFSQLKELSLERTPLSSHALTHLEGSQTTLQTLDLQGIRLLDPSIEELWAFSNLTSLNLSSTVFMARDPRSLAPGRLSKLVSLNLSYSAIRAKELVEVVRLPLTRLKLLSPRRLTRTPLILLSRCTQLQKLALTIAPNTPFYKPFIPSLSALTTLHVEGRGLTSALAAQFSHLTNITQLTLENNGLRDRDLCSLASLSRLSTLEMVNLPLTGEVVASFPTSLRRLKMGTPLQDPLLAPLAHLTALRDLTFLSDLRRVRPYLSLSYLTSLHQLEVFHCPHAQIDPYAFQTLSFSLTNLTQLFLHGSVVSDPMFRQILRLPRLNDLRIPYTAVSVTAFNALQNQKNTLRTIEVTPTLREILRERLRPLQPNLQIL